MKITEYGCLCGDPACRRCFARGVLAPEDIGAAWADFLWDDDKATTDPVDPWPSSLDASAARTWVDDNADALGFRDADDAHAALDEDALAAVVAEAASRWNVLRDRERSLRAFSEGT